MLLKKCFVVLLCVIPFARIFSQEPRGRNEIGIHAGGFFYLGDLAPDVVGSYKTARPAAGLYYTRHFNSYWSARANIMFGELAGDDSLNKKPAYMRKRNFRFHSPLAEASLVAQFDVFGTNTETPVTKISPYLFAGIGVSFLNITRDWSRIDSSMIHVGSSTLAGLTRDNLTKPPTVIPVIPMGVGIKYHAWQHIAFTAEINYRYTFTDYIDGFSYAANPERKDGYYSATVGAVYNFGNGSGNGSGGRSRSGTGRGRGSTSCPKF